MATKKRQFYKPSEDAKGPARKGGKVHKAETIPFAELEEGDSIIGTFQRRRQITIQDRKTKENKDVWLYIFADVKTGNRFAISGRAMLDQTFDELFEANGVDHYAGVDIRINRGKSERTSAGNELGTYEVIVYDEE